MQLQSKSEEINHEMPSLLNQEEFREGGEIQIEGWCSWEGGCFPAAWYFLVLFAFMLGTMGGTGGLVPSPSSGGAER